MKDLALPQQNRITLTDASTVTIDATKGNRFFLSTSSSRTLGSPGAGFDGQVIVIAWKAGTNLTIALTTGSSNAFRFLGSATALSQTASGATDYIVCVYNATDSRWDVVGFSGDFVLQSSSNAAGSDVTMTNAAQFYTGASVSLGVGKWLVMAYITMGRANTTLIRYQARIRDTTNSVNFASGAQTQPSQNPHYVTITLSAIITLTGTATIEIQGATITTGGCLIKAATADNASGNTATAINAVKIG